MLRIRRKAHGFAPRSIRISPRVSAVLLVPFSWVPLSCPETPLFRIFRSACPKCEHTTFGGAGIGSAQPFFFSNVPETETFSISISFQFLETRIRKRMLFPLRVLPYEDAFPKRWGFRILRVQDLPEDIFMILPLIFFGLILVTAIVTSSPTRGIRWECSIFPEKWQATSAPFGSATQ